MSKFSGLLGKFLIDFSLNNYFVLFIFCFLKKCYSFFSFLKNIRRISFNISGLLGINKNKNDESKIFKTKISKLKKEKMLYIT